MADTWQLRLGLRPRARPGDRTAEVASDQVRPRLRPEGRAPAVEDTRIAGVGADPLRPQLRPEGLGRVSAETQEAATIAEAIPLDETTLIGLFNGPDGGSALLRLPGGKVVKVAAGGYVDGGRVTAISEDGVRLERGDRQIVLTMPG